MLKGLKKEDYLNLYNAAVSLYSKGFWPDVTMDTDKGDSCLSIRISFFNNAPRSVHLQVTRFNRGQKTVKAVDESELAGMIPWRDRYPSAELRPGEFLEIVKRGPEE